MRIPLLSALLMALVLPAFAPLSGADDAPVAGPGAEPTRARVIVIPVKDQIAKPILYVIRRGLKEAIDQNIDMVVLDMETPGGALAVTFDIMEAIDRFPGRTATFVNTEAISAGAFISAVTDDIYFAPTGVIGAAAPVLATGGEIDAAMRQKIVSYLRARVRAISEGKAYRGEVISAMIDSDYVLQIGDKVLKEKGELLSLTASEASARYGDPPEPLLAAGIASNVDELLTGIYGEGGYAVTELEVTWSEQLAQHLNRLSSLILGLGMLALFIEFKTPGFGVFGFTGIALMAIVFFGHFVAGLSGHEPALVFAIGFILVLVELIFFPGILVAALGGVVLMLGALVWSMADLWPNEPIAFSGDIFLGPLLKLVLGLAVAFVMALALTRFLPRGWIWDRMILTSAVGNDIGGAASRPASGRVDDLIGRRAVAATGLFPSGQVEIDGRRLEARMAMGFAEQGTEVIVTHRSEFGLIVEKVDA